MRQVSKIVIVWFIIFVGVSWFLTGCKPNSGENPETTPILVWEYKNQTTFDTVYPEGWEYFIVRQGFLVFASQDVTNEAETGPSMTVLRQPPGLSSSSLEEEMDHFLEFGPLRDDYFLISDINPVEIGQYDGLEAAVEREATEMFIAMKSVISIVRTESGSLYTFVATAPTEQWVESWPLLLAISQNVTFNE